VWISLHILLKWTYGELKKVLLALMRLWWSDFKEQSQNLIWWYFAIVFGFVVGGRVVSKGVVSTSTKVENQLAVNGD